MATNFQDASGEIRLVGTIYAPGATVGDVFTVQADGSLAPASGGGSQPFSVIRFPFTFDTPGLASGVGFYTPTVGDLICDFAIAITTVWDGTTPSGDMGPAIANTGGYFSTGVFQASGLDMSSFGWQPWPDGSMLAGFTTDLGSAWSQAAGGGSASLATPFLVTSTKPVSVWVTTTGDPGDPDPGAMQGAAEAFLVVAHPTTVAALP